MEIKENLPLIVYDNQCYLCEKFIKIVNFFARDKITIVGHYTNFGLEIRNEILDESALNMFWFIENKMAYGGRAAIFPLIKTILKNKSKKSSIIKMDKECQQDCKTIKAVFLRSFSLISNSKKISI